MTIVISGHLQRLPWRPGPAADKIGSISSIADIRIGFDVRSINEDISDL